MSTDILALVERARPFTGKGRIYAAFDDKKTGLEFLTGVFTEVPDYVVYSGEIVF